MESHNADDAVLEIQSYSKLRLVVREGSEQTMSDW